MPLSRGRKNCMTTKWGYHTGQGNRAKLLQINYCTWVVRDPSPILIRVSHYKSNLEIAGEMRGKMLTLKGKTLPFGVT